MKINLVGSILGTSGYDSHTRQLAAALYKINPDIKLDVPLSQDYLDHVTDAELKMLKTPSRIPDATIAIMTPPQWRIALGDQTKKFIGVCVWEGDKIPKYWLEYLMDDRVDQIWVPSEHTKDAIQKTLTENNITMLSKIKIVPHGVDIDLFKPKEREENPKFSFLCNKGWRGGMDDRGGVQYVLKAFTEEFSKDEKVELNLHINPAYINPASVRQHMDDLKLDKNSPPIKVSATNIPYKRLPSLYQQADCYVCATRAESFGLDTAEAMACGLPIIATNYGGQIEHIPTVNKFIDYKLEEVKEDIQYEGIRWATPDIKDLRGWMRLAFDNWRGGKITGKVNLLEMQDWTWDKSAEKAMEFLKE